MSRFLQGGRLFEDRAPGGPVPRLLMRWVRRPLLPAVRLWRRNLQLRVVAGTLLMSIGVVLLLGFVVIGQVRNGLLDAKGKAAQTQAAGGFAAAQEKANAPLAPGGQGSEGADGMTGSTSWRTELVDQLASGGKNAFNVVALSADSVTEGAGSRAARGSGSVEASSVPERLRQNVSQGQGAYQTYSLIRYSYGNASQPGLVVGKRLYDIDQQPYELYYLFPLTQEEKSLTLVKTTLATAGLFVVVLLGAIAWFVVRQVVTPVRMAAGIAERL
ncbi:two-component sensor histidine kinase, partial [Streptomyces sp. SID7982]|nr:two-component sensor histidine kinase [Streptomyces sp. SID7982]